uniref:Uncharacterized protein n=1 Tax=Caenorhabditis tropicalis TaxID=1561998 RepID=A0A1I7UL88_9PELO
MTLFYLTAGCNILLLILNITIFYAVLGYMKPTISEIRKQTFIIMDNILVSYIPSKIRKMLSCNPEVKLGEEKHSNGKKSKPPKGTPASKNSKEKSGSGSE